MPVSAAIAKSNRSQTERLRGLVQRLDAFMLCVFRTVGLWREPLLTLHSGIGNGSA